MPGGWPAKACRPPVVTIGRRATFSRGDSGIATPSYKPPLSRALNANGGSVGLLV
jgi:hypothetical protein